MRKLVIETDVLEERLYNNSLHKGKLTNQFSVAPTFRCEWSLRTAPTTKQYRLAYAERDPIMRQKVDEYLKVDESKVCVELQDCVLDEYGINAVIVPTGPNRHLFERFFEEGSLEFVPRLHMDNERDLVIANIDVLLAP